VIDQRSEHGCLVPQVFVLVSKLLQLLFRWTWITVPLLLDFMQFLKYVRVVTVECIARDPGELT